MIEAFIYAGIASGCREAGLTWRQSIFWPWELGKLIALAVTEDAE